MAVAGSGGWIPSQGLTLRDRRLLTSGFTQNKPRDVTVAPDEAVARLLLGEDEIPQVDARSGNLWKVRDMLFEGGHIDERRILGA